ncbi:uncharacterized protein [Leptinotarsa decemlineata]|uniref:uncharacterized protein n=1 Tax=Leptinotarsa decemlineata TaxID=7539 RepID=UPI003D309E4D
MFTEEHGTQSCETTGARNTKPITKLVKRKRRYVGDLNTSDFSSPTKAKKNFKFLKEMVLRQRKKIKSLHNTVRRLKARISTLNDLLKLLKEKFNMSDSSESVIKVL